ncbi:hypothetical protein BGX34_004000 [Mortierella sp. NVP85]|nr:hypothetical protein BGX34_004000 [Mortierella sp. NVP85]
MNYHQRHTSNASRAPNPANNRQVPKDQRGGPHSNTIFCYGCDKHKQRQEFSETQLKKASNRNPKKTHQIMCKTCIPPQTTSIKCHSCSKTLPSSEFSKTQRKRQDKAVCLECRRVLALNDSDEDLSLEEDSDYDDDYDIL